MKKLISICLAALVCLSAFAQQKYTGTVVDAFGDPAPGAVVQVVGTNINAVTGNNGSFSITAQAGQTLEVSLLGMETATVTVPASGHINVTLKESAEFIEETVVVGYGVTRKRDLAGAVSSVKADEIKAGVISNTTDMLRGRAAGVFVHTNDNTPGGSTSIRIRGASSISSNNTPLYVIDGIMQDDDTGVTPDDIESIEILKDAASTAIYGNRGANGVIIITTKKGSADHFTIDYAYNASAKILYNPFHLCDAGDIMNYSMKIWRDNGSQGNPPYTDEQLNFVGRGTDWLNDVARTGWTQTHNVTMGGGSERINASANINYMDNQGIMPNTEYNRFNTRLSVNFKPTKWLTGGVSTFFTKAGKTWLTMNTASSAENILTQLFLASPLMYIGEDGATYNWITGDRSRRLAFMEWIDASDNNSKAFDTTMSAFLEAQLCKGLTARAQYTFNRWEGVNQTYLNQQTFYGSSLKGQSTFDNSYGNYQQVDGLLTYHNNFAGKHDLKLIAGTTFTTNTSEWAYMQAHGYGTDAYRFYKFGAASFMDSMDTSRADKANISYFGRIEYVLLDRYIFNASFRADGSSNFGVNNKWGYFPSASVAWNLGDEAWMKWAKPALTALKLRASWGKTGNDGIGQYKSLKTYANAKNYMGANPTANMMFVNNAGNNSLKWETTTQTDFGFDANLFNGRVEINFDWYKKITTDLLNPIAISYSTMGLENTTGNDGIISNRGVELFIKAHVIEKKNFSWNTTFNFGYNKNRVEKLSYTSFYAARPQGAYAAENYVRLTEGEPMSAIYGYKYIGILQQGETYDKQPNSQPGDPMYEDVNGDGVITPDDRTTIGEGIAPYQIGWGNNFQIGNFDFSFFFDGSFGNSLLNMTRFYLEDQNRTVDAYQNRWSLKNPSTTIGRDNYTTASSYMYGSYVNSNFVEKAGFVRLSNIELGYSIPCKKLGIDKVLKAARVYVGGQRLFTFTKYSGFDPETSSYGNGDASQGLDFSSYPSYRTVNFGAKVTF